ncbi:MAG: CRISPR system precrRNA processing endoribonuclease RAMP protein Cas6 [Acidobacteriaceae bacterium]|nr:CRISPR system precrRNA processing endoribonuclease RAMP protein Cas6 [Acidobacteriaceae bacterium]MBV8572463.1 CRISPR system precrRNA processing endoribonuclease RAMP protein Cas6 [Acidobacteriaceae bacterium]
MNFVVLPARVEFEAQDRLELRAGEEANLFRGALGAALRHLSCNCDSSPAQHGGHSEGCAYARLFEPVWRDGPGGYRNAPRPFVLRCNNNAQEIMPGKTFTLDVFLFDIRESPWAILQEAFTIAAANGFGPARARARSVTLRPADPVRLPITGTPGHGHLRLHFATPTELKEAGSVIDRPHFPTLIHRLAERTRALGRLYQGWTHDASGYKFTEVAEVKLLDCEWTRTDIFRRSASNGEVHSIGGFVGRASYCGPVGRFLPLLEIARWTGVGRQTVWGKGEVRVEAFERL